MEVLNLLSYMATLIAIIGTIANSLKKRWGFYVWLVSNLFWIFYNLYQNQYAQGLLYVFNAVTCIVGLIKWKDKKCDEG